MAQKFTIADLRGGINNSDSPTEIADNQCVDARNIDFRSGYLGAKRRGTQGISIAGSSLSAPVVALFRHSPTNNVSQDELWALDEEGNLDRRVGGTWQNGVDTVNDHVIINNANYIANAVSLHGKLFIAAQGTQDRLLVWDGTVLRWAGIQEAQPPTVANTGSGTFAETRYYRIRYTEQNANGTTIRRSEPSTVVSFAPSGSGSAARITKPAGTEVTTSAYCEGQTHWEVEASLDNILFYRIATVAIGTSTYDDTTAFSTGYSSNTLSDTIGDYVVPGAARFVAVDEDRLLMAGNYFSITDDATVWWTPVASSTGVGNDERIPTATSNFITFDGIDGGGVTAIVAGVAGNVFVFKRSRVYKMVRTGILTSAYAPTVESFTRGCDMLGAVAGADRNGLPCAYFVDPSTGLCELGSSGIQDRGRAIRSTWYGNAPDPAVPPRILYYPALEQVWFTLPAGSGDVLQTSDQVEIHTADADQIVTAITVPSLLAMYEARTGGIIFYDGIPAGALTLALLYRETGLAPVVGTELKDIGGGNTSYIHEADTGTTDSDGNYRAYVITKPYLLGDLWDKFGLMAGALIAKAASGTTLLIRMLRNFSIETRDVTVDLSPAASEVSVVKPIDNASMSELNAIQIEYGDEDASAQEWDLDRLVFKIRQEEDSA